MRKRYSVDKSLSHPWLQVMRGEGLELALSLATQVAKGAGTFSVAVECGRVSHWLGCRRGGVTSSIGWAGCEGCGFTFFGTWTLTGSAGGVGSLLAALCARRPQLTGVFPCPGVPDVAGPSRAGGEDGRAVHHARE